jgi:tetratricopeptide repeat protein
MNASRNYRFLSLLILVWSLSFAMPVAAQGVKLAGKWATRMGVIRIHQKGKKVSGKLIWVSKTCPFKRGDEILKGVLLEDSLSGKWRYCLKGKECKGDKWAPMVMLVARAGRVLSGAAHYKASECNIGGKGRGDGVVVRKLKRKPKQPKPPKQSDGGTRIAKAEDAGTKVEPGEASTEQEPMLDEDGQPMEEEVKPLNPEDYKKNAGDWRSVMEEGAGQMGAGFFERARRHFKKATQLDPTRPEAFSGIGVTYYARGDYEEALNWYKKALEVDPNFGDAYYNMACIYSLTKKNSLAFRYLHIAVLNGYAEFQAMEQDEDLKNLRADKRYKDILKKMKAAK